MVLLFIHHRLLPTASWAEPTDALAEILLSTILRFLKNRREKARAPLFGIAFLFSREISLLEYDSYRRIGLMRLDSGKEGARVLLPLVHWKIGNITAGIALRSILPNGR